MRRTITTQLTIPKEFLLGKDGLGYLQKQINNMAEDLLQEYPSVEYISHEMIEGYSDSAETDHFTYVVTYRVGTPN